MNLRTVQPRGNPLLLQAALSLLGSAALLAAPVSPRAYYNEGVAKLTANDLSEAESLLRRAVESNNEIVQPAALYNLGHVRFQQGKETLKGEGNRQQLLDTSAAVTALAREVSRRAAPIAEKDDLQELINAYMEARAARKQLRQARDENTRALDLLGSALSRWRRSVGDFQGAAELNPGNQDATFNADVVERHIAALLKFIKKVEMQQEGIGEEREKLKELMKKMRGKIPKEMQRGSDDEEEDEDEEPQDEEGKKDKEKETAKQQQQRIGQEREIDPDMLRVLKESIRPRPMSVGQDGEREGVGPDGQKPGGDPKGKKGRDW